MKDRKNSAKRSEKRAVRRPEARERHEPRYTKIAGLIAPKFGSAGSGGAEYELLDEAHDSVQAMEKPVPQKAKSSRRRAS